MNAIGAGIYCMRRSNSTKALVPSTRTCGSSSEADCNLVSRAERCRGTILGERARGARRTKARLLAQHWSSSPSARTASRLLHAITCCRSRFSVGQGRRFQPGRGLRSFDADRRRNRGRQTWKDRPSRSAAEGNIYERTQQRCKPSPGHAQACGLEEGGELHRSPR